MFAIFGKLKPAYIEKWKELLLADDRLYFWYYMRRVETSYSMRTFSSRRLAVNYYERKFNLIVWRFGVIVGSRQS